MAAGSAGTARRRSRSCVANRLLGATDIDNVLRAAASRFDKDRGRRVACCFTSATGAARQTCWIPIRSERSSKSLSPGHIAVSSYAVGPQCDGRLLAALANQTGGILYVAEPMVRANDAEKITDARAKEENLRNGAGSRCRNGRLGAGDGVLADRRQLGRPNSARYIRSRCRRCDRIATRLSYGSAAGPLNKAVEVRAQVVVNGKPAELHWSAKPKNKGDAYAFLPQMVDLAQHDGGITLPDGRLARSGRNRPAARSGMSMA